jgi:hypothetical protein
MHLEQARLAHLTLGAPYLGNRTLLVDLVKSAARDDFGMGMELAYQYPGRIRVARTYAEVAVEYLERWTAGHLLDTSPQKLTICGPRWSFPVRKAPTRPSRSWPIAGFRAC